MGQEVEIAAADGGKFIGYLSLPSSPRAPGLIVLPEVFNTNAHIRAVVDGYASAGFVALAPDVYWRQEAGNYLPYTDEGRAKAQSLRARLDTDQFTRDLGDAIAALRARPECTGKVGVMGFCLGASSPIWPARGCRSKPRSATTACRLTNISTKPIASSARS